MPKKRKVADQSWRPGTSSTSTTSKHPNNTEGLLHLMGVAGSPAKTVVVEHDLMSPPSFVNTRSKMLSPRLCFRSPLTFSFKTPTNGSRLLVSREITCDNGKVKIFLSEGKVGSNRLSVPAIPNDWVKNFSDFSSVSTVGKEFKITKEIIEKTNKVTAKRRKLGKSSRSVSQNQVMGISAKQVLSSAGIVVDDAHWVHMDVPHEFVGDEAQTMDNLAIGLKYGNGAMELVNRALYNIFFHENSDCVPPVLYLHSIKTWKVGYENIRLLDTLEYIVRDDNGNSVSIPFDMLSTDPVCTTEIEPIEELLKKKFNLKPVSQKLTFS